MSISLDSFIPLGTFCYSANILKSLGLRSHAYPLDYTFAKLSHISHMLETKFDKLLDKELLYPAITLGPNKSTGHMLYGHLFRHHDLTDESQLSAMKRRVDRLLENLQMGSIYLCTLNEAHGDYVQESTDGVTLSIEQLEFCNRVIEFYQLNRIIMIYLKHGSESDVRVYNLMPRIYLVSVTSSLGVMNTRFDGLGGKVMNTQNGMHLYCSATEKKLRESLVTLYHHLTQ